MQGRLIQTKEYYKLFHSVSKEVPHKPLKVTAAKKSFPSVFIIDTTSFDEFFSFHVITTNSIFHTNLSLPRGLVEEIRETSVFERNPHVIYIISTIILW